MSCESCGSTTTGGPPKGCKSNGSCMTGGCNKLNTFNWLVHVPIPEDQRYDMVEVSFKNGSRKDFFRNSERLDVMTGDMVAVESDSGFDVGKISLSGELVKTQIKKKNWAPRQDQKVRRVLRKAREQDIDKLRDARAKEGAVMLRARKMAMALQLDMKIGDVEFQGDNRKATFYYTAENRIDFRELIKQFAQEFRVKIDMRQIGARQEAGKIGGIGACGRELCCSTWLTEFKSVSTSAARYQNLAINQSKLSGQCGRLKCCLNYELDTYTEALKEFPKGAKILKTKEGVASLIKTDVLKRLMYYVYPDSPLQFALEPAQVQEILELNSAGQLAEGLQGLLIVEPVEKEIVFVEDGQVSLRTLEKSSRKSKNKRGKTAPRRGRRTANDKQTRDTRQSGNKQKSTRERKDLDKKEDKSGIRGNRTDKSRNTKGKPKVRPASGSGGANESFGRRDQESKSQKNPAARKNKPRSQKNNPGGRTKDKDQQKPVEKKTNQNRSRKPKGNNSQNKKTKPGDNSKTSPE